MSKKKGTNWEAEIVKIVILVILASMAGAYVVHVFSSQEKYNITQTTCVNETKWSDDCIPIWMICYVDNPESIKNETLKTECLRKIVSLKLNGTFKFEHEESWSTCVQVNLGTEQKCETRRVDEIKTELDCEPLHYNRADYPDNCMKALSCASYCIPASFIKPIFKDDKAVDIKQCVEDCRKTYLIKSTSKKDLTEKWLDENCEKNIVMKCERDGKESCIDYTKRTMRPCSDSCSGEVKSWKCGNYEVTNNENKK